MTEMYTAGLMRNQDEAFKSFYGRYYTENLGATIKKNGREIIMMGSVNYLGLSHHPKVVEASIKAIEKHGSGGIGSRYSNGCLDIHFQLEDQVKEFFGRDDCVLFNSGYMANLGTISAFGNDALIFSDKENHLSIYDGCRLSGCKYLRFKHNDPDHLEYFLEKNRQHSNKWLVLVGTFGVTGENIRLRQLVRIAKKYDVKVYLDDAHLIGVEGEHKRGLSEKEEIHDKIDLLMGSFQMAFGNIGAFVAGSEEFIKPIRYNSRPYVFSYTLPASNVAALMKAFEIISSEEGTNLINQLRKNVHILREGLKELDFQIITEDSQIISLRVGKEEHTAYISQELLRDGIWVQNYVNPSVPLGQSSIRLTCMATQKQSHLDKVLNTLSQHKDLTKRGS